MSVISDSPLQAPPRMGMLLEHQYTPKQVQPKNLKGRDLTIYQTLVKHGLCVTVAPIEVIQFALIVFPNIYMYMYIYVLLRY